MTAHDLFTIVKPLIGTEWEPEGLNTVTMIYCAPGEELQSPVCLPVPAARAMWESSIMDRLLALPTSGPQRAVLMLARVAEGFATDSTKAEFGDWTGHHPTRLHALVAAAEACKQ